jgi:hypothetical protein
MRLVGLATGLVLLVGVMTAPPSLAKAACNNDPTLRGTADIALVQSVSGPTAGGNYLDHLTITNFGPCNVPNAGLSVTLPGALVSSRSNPNSWICSGATSVTCYETSTIGVPGTADIYLEYVPANGLVFACGATFGTVDQLASCPSSGGSVTDPNTANNTSTVAAGVLGAGGTLVYGPAGNPIPTSAFDHTTSVTLANGGLVNIYQTTTTPGDHSTCPSGVPNCFLGTITVTFGVVNGAKTWTLSFLASLAGKKALSQITVWNSIGGVAFSALTNCNAQHPTDPCVQNRSRSTNADGNTVYTIVVQGTKDNGMTAD